MSAYLLGAIDVRDRAGYDAYQRAAAAALVPYPVEFLALDPAPVMLEGKQPAGHLFVIRFASMADARAFYDSEAYARARDPARSERHASPHAAARDRRGDLGPRAAKHGRNR